MKEGDFVHKGDVLATLAIPEASTQEKVAEAAAGATDALSALAEGPTRRETVESAYQIYQQAIAANDIAEKDLRSYATIVRRRSDECTET